MKQFQLSKQSPGASLTKFHVLDSAGSIIGSINVQNEDADDLAKHWLGSCTASQSPGRSNARRQSEPHGRRDGGRLKETRAAQPSRHPARLSLTSPRFLKPLNRDFGVSGLVRTCAWLDRVAGLEVLNIGRSAFGKDDCVAELVGTQLLIHVALYGGWIWVSACGMDEAEPPELLFNIGDGVQGWVTVRKFLLTLERSGVRSLKTRPVRIGGEGKDAFTIA